MAFVRRKKISGKNMVAVQLVEGARDPISGKVKQKVLKHIGSSDNEEELQQLVTLGHHLKFELKLKNQPCLFSEAELLPHNKPEHSLEDCPEKYQVQDVRQLHEEGRYIIGIHDIYGKIYDQLGFENVIKNPRVTAKSTRAIKDLVLARISSPQSKRSSMATLSKNFGIDYKLDLIYRSMDHLDDFAIINIQNAALYSAQSLFKQPIDVLFYDVTTLYFESFEEGDLRAKGFSKDHKSNETQVVLSLYVTKHGMPVGYKVFPGNKYEGHTLIESLNELKDRYSIDKVVFVADSGMLNKANLDLLQEHGYKYIVGGKIKNMSQAITNAILEKEMYLPLNRSDDSVQYHDIKLNEEQRLICTYSKKRARKDEHERNKRLAKLEKSLSSVKSLKSQIKWGVAKKYAKIEGKAVISIDNDKVEEDAKWDGLHGITTNSDMPAKDAISQYKGLWQIEETFRLAKHNLEIRPIYHWTDKRIKAHIAICFMALCCMRYAEYMVSLHTSKLSPERIKDALNSVQVTKLAHLDGRTFGVPSKVSADAKTIYRIFNKKLNSTPYII